MICVACYIPPGGSETSFLTSVFNLKAEL